MPLRVAGSTLYRLAQNSSHSTTLLEMLIGIGGSIPLVPANGRIDDQLKGK